MDPVTRKQEGLERASEKTLLILQKKQTNKKAKQQQQNQGAKEKG